MYEVALSAIPPPPPPPLRHLQSTIASAALELTQDDVARIGAILAGSNGPKGEVYGLERDPGGRHGALMKHNLSQVNGAAHLEELCHRCVEIACPPALALWLLFVLLRTNVVEVSGAWFTVKEILFIRCTTHS